MVKIGKYKKEIRSLWEGGNYQSQHEAFHPDVLTSQFFSWSSPPPPKPQAVSYMVQDTYQAVKGGGGGAGWWPVVMVVAW